MKKILAILLIVFMLVPTVSVFAATNALYTTSGVTVNGKAVEFEAYNIGGNNYFKLRDVAKALSGSEKQFEVTWDEKAGAINLVSGKAYTEVGGELKAGNGKNKSAKRTDAKIMLDGEWIDEDALTAYNIGGNNYFKLRDLGMLFDFGVNWNDVVQRIIVKSSESYVDDGIKIAQVKDNKKAIYSLTTDDNCLYTNYWLDARLKERGLVGTLGLVTSMMGNSSKLTWENAQELVNSGRWGVANHTVNHRQAEFLTLTEEEYEYEIGEAKKILLSKFPSEKILSMYTPGNLSNAESSKVIAKYHLGHRSGGSAKGITALPYKVDGTVMISKYQIDENSTVQGLRSNVNDAINQRAWYTEMWHGVGDVDYAKYGLNISETIAEQHLNYIEQKVSDGSLWCATLDDALSYVLKYKHASLKLVSKNDKKAVFDVTGSFDRELTDVPLTVTVKVPDGCKSISATQNGKSVKTSMSKNTGLVDVQPDGGQIVVTFKY